MSEQVSVDRQINIIEDQMRDRREHIERSLTTMFQSVKMPNDMNAYMVQCVVEDLMEQMRQATIVVVLDMLTHPQRFEMFAQMASRLKEQEKES